MNNCVHLNFVARNKTLLALWLENTLSDSISGHIFEASISDIFVYYSFLFFGVKVRALTLTAFSLQTLTGFIRVGVIL